MYYNQEDMIQYILKQVSAASWQPKANSAFRHLKTHPLLPLGSLQGLQQAVGEDTGGQTGAASENEVSR